LIEAMSRALSPGSTLPDASFTDHRIQRAAA
jgi:hypothetical protein